MNAPYTIKLTTRDGQGLSFPCAPEQYLLDAAEAAHITLPTACRNGSCGACKGTGKAGDVDRTGTAPEAMTQAQLDAGAILFCRTKPKSDLEVTVDSDLAQITAGPVPTFPCTITTLEDLGGDVKRLKISVGMNETGEALPPFDSGQYFELQIPGTETWRAYSIANAPDWCGELEFLIRLQPGGQFSNWLRARAVVGQTIKGRGPQGRFTLRQGSLNPRFFVCGGTGLAPMMSMLKTMADFQETNPAYLYFGVNEEKDLFASRDIQDLQSRLQTLKITTCLWKSSRTWDGFVGTPVDAMRPELLSAIDAGFGPEVYVCGPPALINATEALAADLGLSADTVLSESF